MAVVERVKMGRNVVLSRGTLNIYEGGEELSGNHASDTPDACRD